MTKPEAVTDSTFEQEVLAASQPVLVDFGAAWCGPCKMLDPIVEELADDYAGQIKVVKLDADANPSTVQTFGVMGLPTLILFKGGEAVERVSGFMSKDRLLHKLADHF